MLAYPTTRPANREATGGEGRADRSETRVELWCEANQTSGRNEFARAADRLRALAERGDVDAAAVETWDRYVDVSGGSPDDEATRATLDRLGRLDRWRWRHGDGDALPTESRTAGRGRLGPPLTVRRVPRAALVEFENGVVTNVTLADERTGCLVRRLETIAERERSATEERTGGDPRERLFS